MDDEEIRRRLDELDAAIIRQDAQLVIYMEDSDDQEFEIVGNRQGYLRGGIEMLRAAIAPLGPDDSFLPNNINYLIQSKRSFFVKRLVRTENVESALPTPRTSTWKSKVAGAGCLILLIFLVICAFVGLGTIGRWIIER